MSKPDRYLPVLSLIPQSQLHLFSSLSCVLHFSVPSNAKHKPLKAFSVLLCYSLSYCSSVLGLKADSGSASHADSEQCGSVRAPHHDIFLGISPSETQQSYNLSYPPPPFSSLSWDGFILANSV